MRSSPGARSTREVCFGKSFYFDNDKTITRASTPTKREWTGGGLVTEPFAHTSSSRMRSSSGDAAAAVSSPAEPPPTPHAHADGIADDDSSLLLITTQTTKKLRHDDDDDDATLLPSLPDDVLARIFRQIGDPKTLAALSCVCKTWRTSLPDSGAWVMLCEEAGRAPRWPRKPWREVCLDNLRRRQRQLEQDHELLVLRLTMDPRKGGGAKNGDVGAMRRDRPRRLRKLLAALAGARFFWGGQEGGGILPNIP